MSQPWPSRTSRSWPALHGHQFKGGIALPRLRGPGQWPTLRRAQLRRLPWLLQTINSPQPGVQMQGVRPLSHRPGTTQPMPGLSLPQMLGHANEPKCCPKRAFFPAQIDGLQRRNFAATDSNHCCHQLQNGLHSLSNNDRLPFDFPSSSSADANAKSTGNTCNFSIDRLIPPPPPADEPPLPSEVLQRRSLGLLWALVCCVRQFCLSLPQLPTLLDRGWHQLFLAHSPSLLSIASTESTDVPLHGLLCRLAQLRLSPLEHWALGCALFFHQNQTTGNGQQVREMEEQAWLTLIQSALALAALGTNDTGICAQQRRLARMAALAPQLMSIDQTQVLALFFANQSVDRIRSLWAR